MDDLIDFESAAPPKDETSFTTLFNSNDFNVHLNFDLGRESIPFRPSTLGRESLQVLDLAGRESLGILNPTIRLTDPDFLLQLPVSDGDAHNTASLHPFSMLDRRISMGSSGSSNAFNLINSSNFSESAAPSTIYSASSLRGLSSSDFNNGFSMSPFSRDKLYSELNQRIDERMRLYSLPTVPEIETDSDAGRRRCTSAEVKTTNSRTSSLEDDDEFNNSVFIEAHHIACKIADGSILEASYEEGNILDCTPQPLLANDESDVEMEKVVKCDKESMFRAIDRIIPPQIPEAIEEEVEVEIEEKQKEDERKVEEEPERSSNAAGEECKQNLLDALNGERKVDVSNISNRSSKFGEAREIILKLSNLLDGVDDERKIAGRSLLLNLADLMCSSTESVCSSISSEDSGHSSIEDKRHNRQLSGEQAVVEEEDDEMVQPEVVPMDVGKSVVTSVSLTERLTQAGEVDNKSRLCQSLGPALVSNNLNDQAMEMKNIIIGMETKCNVSNDSNASSVASSASISSKLKPKRFEETKKGPLKAVLPVNAITKKKDLLKESKICKSPVSKTPLKRQSLCSSLAKRTSTPLITSKLKPMAQSTPDRAQPQSKLSIPLACSSQIKKKAMECSLSPMIRSSSFDEMCSDNMNNKSDSVTNTTEGSKVATPTGLIRPRRYSVGKENLLSRKLPKPVSTSDPKRTEDAESSRIALRNTSNRSIGMKPTNLVLH